MLPRSNRVVAGLVVALCAASPSHTRAELNGASASLDESTFIQKVRERSPRREVFDARRRAASAQVRIAGVLPNPTLSYERESVPSLDSTDDFVRLSWPVDLSGRRGLATAAARANATADRLDADRDAWLFEIEARQAFLDALYARERLARLDASRIPLATLVDALRSRAQQGDASSYDADRAALELDGLDDDRATARRALEVAGLRLGALMGSPATPVAPVGELVLPSSPTAAIAPQRADLDAALARAEQADRDLGAARRKWIPRLELMGGMMASSQMGRDGVGYVLGIGGDLPVFDRGGAAADRARADVKRWRSEARALTTEIAGEVVQARRDLEMRIVQAQTYINGPATRAVDIQRRAAVAYREGDRPILELLDVQRTATHAAVRALELIYEARRAELALARVTGRQP